MVGCQSNLSLVQVKLPHPVYACIYRIELRFYELNSTFHKKRNAPGKPIAMRKTRAYIVDPKCKCNFIRYDLIYQVMM